MKYEIFQRCTIKPLIIGILMLFSLCSCTSGSIDIVEEATHIEESISPTQKHDYQKTPYVDYTLTDVPKFVDDISECTDTEMQYVLPDGYLYEYKPVPNYSVVNQLAISVDIDGSIFNGCGYQNNSRIRSVLEIGDISNGYVTGLIPVTVGDIIYFKDNCYNLEYTQAHVMHTVFYDNDKQIIGSTSMQAATESYLEIIEQNDDGYVTAMRIKEDSSLEGLAFVRLSLIGSGEQQIISINEPLIASYETYSWMRGELYVGEEWYKEIDSTIEVVNDIDLVDKSTSIKFLFATDIHLDPYLNSSYTEDIGRVCAEVMRSCDIPFFITGGDNSTQSSGFVPADFKNNMKDLLSQFMPIPQKNILLAVGNHDGATGSYESNGETLYYRYQLNNEERSAVFFGWQRETNENKHFDADGTYYYIDDSDTKTRYIILNSFWSQWEGNENGYVSDINHSFFHKPVFGSQQLEWFAEEALDMPQGHGAIIVTHFAPEAMDFEVFKGIVDAFSNQTIYTGSYEGVSGWQSSNIAVNYENAYGEIIAVFQGHRHTNEEYDYFDKVPCINTTTTGAYWAVKDQNAEVRVKDDATEFAVDVVVIDRATRKIYITRLGAGTDRLIKY